MFVGAAALIITSVSSFGASYAEAQESPKHFQRLDQLPAKECEYKCVSHSNGKKYHEFTFYRGIFGQEVNHGASIWYGLVGGKTVSHRIPLRFYARPIHHLVAH